MDRMVFPSLDPKLLAGCKLRLESRDNSLPLLGMPALPVNARLLLRLPRVLPSWDVLRLLRPDFRESTMLG